MERECFEHRKAEPFLEGRRQPRRVLVAPAEHPVAHRATNVQTAAPLSVERRAVSSLCGPGLPSTTSCRPGEADATRSQMSSNRRTFFRRARFPTTSANDARRRARPVPVSVEEVAAACRSARRPSSRPKQSKVAEPVQVLGFAATSRSAWSSDVQYWRGRTSRLAGDDSWASVIVITSCTVRTVGSSSRGTRCFVPWTIWAPARGTGARSRTAPRPRWGAGRGPARSGPPRELPAASWTSPAAAAGAATIRRRRRGARARRARPCTARSRPAGRSCRRRGRRREAAETPHPRPLSAPAVMSRHRGSLGRSDAHSDGLQPLASGGRRRRRAVRPPSRRGCRRRGPRGPRPHARRRGPDVVHAVEPWPYPIRTAPTQPARRRAALPRARPLQPAPRRGLDHVLDELAPDVVHTHAVQGLSSVALTRPAGTASPHVHTLHDYLAALPAQLDGAPRRPRVRDPLPVVCRDLVVRNESVRRSPPGWCSRSRRRSPTSTSSSTGWPPPRGCSTTRSRWCPGARTVPRGAGPPADLRVTSVGSGSTRA